MGLPIWIFGKKNCSSSLKHSNINVGMSKNGYILIQILSLKRGLI